MRPAVNAAVFATVLLASPALAAVQTAIGASSSSPKRAIATAPPLAVADGQVRYAGEAGANVSGTVAAGGAVKVSIRMGDKGANGTGHLSGTAGAGTWRGSGGGASCAGRWEAEKR
jgi:hypothetical protein